MPSDDDRGSPTPSTHPSANQPVRRLARNMFGLTRQLTCPNPNCRAFVGGNFCKFCKEPLPQKRGFALVVGFLRKPIRMVVTFVQTAVLPWRVGAYLAEGKQGAISGPFEMLSYAVTFYVGTCLVLFSEVETDDRKPYLAYALIDSELVLSFLYVLFHWHLYLRLFGSAKRFRETVEAAAYPLSLGLLFLVFLVRWKVGHIYSALALDPFPEVPLWQTILENALIVWIALIIVIILS